MEVSKTPCPYCNGIVSLTDCREIYPHRPDLWHKPMWACMPCKAWAGCHPGGTRRAGRIANAATRKLKIAAHDAFDPLWKSGQMKRTAAYAWLREATGLSERDCHMGWMTDAQLIEVVRLCEARQ